jgi:hypothetical protein
LPLNLTLLKGASLVGVFWGEFVKRESKAHALVMQQLLRWLADGSNNLHISARYALADSAIRRSLADSSGRIIGAVTPTAAGAPPAARRCE